jgi:hypothetical protein
MVVLGAQPNKGNELTGMFMGMVLGDQTKGDVCSDGSGCRNKGNELMRMFGVVILGAKTKEMDVWGCFQWWFLVLKQRTWTYGDV